MESWHGPSLCLSVTLWAMSKRMLKNIHRVGLVKQHHRQKTHTHVTKCGFKFYISSKQQSFTFHFQADQNSELANKEFIHLIKNMGGSVRNYSKIVLHWSSSHWKARKHVINAKFSGCKSRMANLFSCHPVIVSEITVSSKPLEMSWE